MWIVIASKNDAMYAFLHVALTAVVTVHIGKTAQ